MLYNPGILSTTELAKAKQPETGENKRVYLSHEEAIVLATIETDGSGNPTLTTGDISLDPPRHFHLVLRRLGGESTETDDIDIAINAEPLASTSGIPLALQATLDLPSFSPNRQRTAYKMPLGLASDFVHATTGGAAVTSYVASITGDNNLPKNSTFEVIALPTEWTEVACVTNATGPRSGPASLAIGCGYDPQKFVVKARGEVQNLTLTAKHRSALLDIQALFGARVCVRVDIWKDGEVLTERWVYTGHVINGGPDRGEETGEVTTTSEGPFERCLLFYAR